MDPNSLEGLYAEVEREFQRAAYPDGFPALPDLPAPRW